MAFSGLQLFPGEPIVVATFKGYVIAEEVRTCAASIAKALEQSRSGYLYAIADVTEITSDFAQVLAILHDQNKGEAGTATDPRVHVSLVGSATMAKLYVEGMRQRQNGGVNIPMFAKLNDALNAARVQIRQQRFSA